MKLTIDFAQKERPFKFSPSVVSLGWEYALCQYLLHKAGVVENKMHTDMVRMSLGFVFEYAFHLDHPEYNYQVPVVIPVSGEEPMEGTLDFYKLEDNTLTVLDTKLVASSQAKSILAGRCPYYELQLMLYTNGLLESGKLGSPELDLRLVVCDRNYLNYKYHTVVYDEGKVEQAKDWYKALTEASRNPSYLKRLISVVGVDFVHPWVKYTYLKDFMNSDEALRKALLELAEKGGCL